MSYNIQHSHALREEARARSGAGKEKRAQRGAAAVADSGDEEDADVLEWKNEVLMLRSMKGRLDKALENVEQSLKAGLLVRPAELGGHGSAIPPPDALGVLQLIDHNLQEMVGKKIKYGQSTIQFANVTDVIEFMQRVSGVSRDTMYNLRAASQAGLGVVQGVALQRRRGPDPRANGTNKFTLAHLLVLILYFNLNQKFAVDRSMAALASVFRSLPEAGSPIKVLLQYINHDATPAKFKEQEYRDVAKSSPGPIPDCTETHVNAAIGAINNSPDIEHYIIYCTREEGNREGTHTASVDQQAEERRKFQVDLHFYEYLAREWDGEAKREHQPQPRFKADRYFKLENWMRTCKRPIVYKDESWFNLNLTSSKIWIDKLGDSVFGTEGGERYVIFTAVTEDGFVGWRPDDYGKCNFIFDTRKETPSMQNKHLEAYRRAGKASESLNAGELLPTGREPENKKMPFTSGMMLFRSGQTAKEASGEQPQTASSYKTTFNGDTSLEYLLLVCETMNAPCVIVLDRAPYNMRKFPAGELDVYSFDVTLTEMEKFLKDEYKKHGGRSDYAEVYLKHYTAAGERINKSAALKDILLAELREKIKEPSLTEIQIRLAEAGIRRFGYPHIVVYLPVRMPSWDPVEFIFAQFKHLFKRNRLLRLNKDGEIAGGQGANEYRECMVRSGASLTQANVMACVGHVHKLYEHEWTANPGNEDQARLLATDLDALLKSLGVETTPAMRSKMPFLFAALPQKVLMDGKGRVKSGLTPTRNRTPQSTSESEDDSLGSPVSPPGRSAARTARSLSRSSKTTSTTALRRQIKRTGGIPKHQQLSPVAQRTLFRQRKRGGR